MTIVIANGIEQIEFQLHGNPHLKTHLTEPLDRLHQNLAWVGKEGGVGIVFEHGTEHLSAITELMPGYDAQRARNGETESIPIALLHPQAGVLDR